MRRFTLEIGQRTDGVRGLHLNLVDENGRATGPLTLGELLEQITGLAVAEGWPPRRPEVYPMFTPQQEAVRQALRDQRRAQAAHPLPHHSV
ncbi:MAG: hypothetical protein EKK53_15215 [Burkholderiales bacterium]|nr:MAG: hypothetical protein EKK53_15215 [Burkholderiales bacterium]